MSSVQVSEYALFPTRLVTLQFAGVGETNRQLAGLFGQGGRFGDDFDMHPDSLNLLSLAGECPPVARLREMFLEGLRHWLTAEQVRGPLSAEMVLFSNYAGKGDFTL